MKHRIRVGAIIVKDSKILLVKHVHPIKEGTLNLKYLGKQEG